MLVGKKRLSLAGSPMDWVKGVLADPRMELAPIEPRIAVEAGLLPRAIHGDPADRLLIATARALACPVLTPDRKLLAYAEEGYLQALDARL